jgi:hypothetical protein
LASKILARDLVEHAEVEHAEELLMQEHFEFGVTRDHAFRPQRRLHRQFARYWRLFRAVSVVGFAKDFLKHVQYPIPRKERFFGTPRALSVPRSERSMSASATVNLLFGSIKTAALP